MTREERAAWLEEWADECQRKGGNSIREGDTRLAKFREPDGEIVYHIGNTRPALMPNDSGGDPVIHLDSLEADNED